MKYVQRFITQVRQYAAIARRTGKGYPHMVQGLFIAAQADIEQTEKDPSEVARMLHEMRDFMDREYAPFDPTFKTP